MIYDSGTGLLRKRNPSILNRSRTHNLAITKCSATEQRETRGCSLVVYAHNRNLLCFKLGKKMMYFFIQ